jgi:hypothetical protein
MRWLGDATAAGPAERRSSSIDRLGPARGLPPNFGSWFDHHFGKLLSALHE